MRQAGPGQHHTDLLGVVALNPRQIDRQDKYRAVEGDAEQEVSEDAEAKVAAEQQPQVQQRLLAGQFDPQEQRQRNGGDDRQPDDEWRSEPVVLVAFLEHGLQRA